MLCHVRAWHHALLSVRFKSFPRFMFRWDVFSIYHVFELQCYCDLGRFVGATWASSDHDTVCTSQSYRTTGTSGQRPEALTKGARHKWHHYLFCPGTTKHKSCPLLVFKPDEPLSEPYQLHVQLLYVPHTFRGINWLRRSGWVEWIVRGVNMAANVALFGRMQRHQTSHHVMI